MNGMSKFQIITLAIFIIAIVGGVIAFATYRSDTSSISLPEITVWGTFPAETFNSYVSQINTNLDVPVDVTYVEKSPEKFSQEFVSALARGIGPDVVLLPADRLLPEENKLTPIPYTALTEREFVDSYIQEAKIYMRNDGIIGLPFTVDPLVMFWNRDTFNSAGFSTYPKYWDEFSQLGKSLNSKDQNGNLQKSVLAMGTFNNITNAREVLATLLFQTGNSITSRSSTGAVSTLNDRSVSDPASALSFFTKFADPANPDYSWNKGMQNDKTTFLSGKLATYLGMASELKDIRAKNPNLNFDVAPIPQPRSGGKFALYGKMYGFSIVKASPKQNSAYQTISILTTPDFLYTLSQKMYLPTVLNNQKNTDLYVENFNKAALISKTWLDADPAQSRRIFGTMVDTILSSKKSVNEAIRDAHDEYNVVLEQSIQ